MIDKGILEAIEILLGDANAQCVFQHDCVILGDVEADLQRVLNGGQMAVTGGNRFPNPKKGGRGQALTAIVLIARHIDGRIGIGVGTCDAHHPAPDNCWRSLRGEMGHCRFYGKQKRINSWIESEADIVLGADATWWPEGPATLVERNLVRGEL